MLITKKDFVKYGCKLIDNRFYVNIGGKWYKLKKSKYAMNYSPIHVNDRMTGKMHDMCACSTSCAAISFAWQDESSKDISAISATQKQR